MKKTLVVVGRLVLAALSLTGVVTQLVISATGGHGVVNFFSYFTILSNIFASAVFVISAIRLLRGYTPTASDVAIRGASVVYMVFVGVVFNTLLTEVALGPLLPWVNVVHHMIMPIAVVVDWLVWPPRRRITLRTAALYLVFPAVYTIYSLVRGSITGFYAYPFFNPAQPGGYGGVAAYCAGLLVAFALVALLVRWSGNLRVRSEATADDPAPR